MKRIRIRSPFTRSRDDEIECKREVKYDTKNIEIGGVKYGLELSGVKIYSSSLQKVHHALMLLDYSQFKLCMTIKNIRNPQVRDKYVIAMADDNLRAQKIHEAFAAFYINPKSEKIEATIQELLSSSPRILEIERNLQIDADPAEKALRIDHTTFQQKMKALNADPYTEAKFYDITCFVAQI